MVLQLLWKLLKVGLSMRNQLASTCLLQHRPVPVIGSYSSQQDPILAPGENTASDAVSRDCLLKGAQGLATSEVPLATWGTFARGGNIETQLPTGDFGL